jgi:hypothetical protein
LRDLQIHLAEKLERCFMKFVSLRERAYRPSKPDKPPSATGESFAKPMSVHHQIQTYIELRQQIHDDLRVQHPEWVQPNGESPMCDSYEARLMEELDTFARRGSNESVADIHRALG